MTTPLSLLLPPATQTLPIKPSHKLSSKTARVLSALTSSGTGAIILSAASPAAAKAISIAEIAKRQCGPKCYQYTILTSETVDVPGPSRDDDDDEEDPFVARPERRNVAVLTIVISRERVMELAERYGEQEGGGAEVA